MNLFSLTPRFLTNTLLVATAVLTGACVTTSAPVRASARVAPSSTVESSDAPVSERTEAPETARLLEVHFIDVGQGDAALIRSPSGKAILIDAGGPGAGPVVASYIEALGIESLDLAIGSHPHVDHIGGMLEVLKRIRPKIYMDPDFPHPVPQYERLLEWLEDEEVPVRLARGGRSITVEPGIVLELLAPTEPLLENTRSDANSNSVVARLVHGEVTFLFTGDAEDVTERRLLKNNRDGVRATVLQVAHHGSRHSTSSRWLSAVSPEVAVMSLGTNNSYGHPHPQLLERLEKKRVRVFRTDRDGDVIAYSDGQSVRWETTGERSAQLDKPGGRSSYSGRPIPPLPKEEERVDVNTASLQELMKIPGIGRGLGPRIIHHRQERGPFKSVDQLTDVNGIGDATLERIRPYVTTSNSKKRRPRRADPAKRRRVRQSRRATRAMDANGRREREAA